MSRSPGTAIRRAAVLLGALVLVGTAACTRAQEPPAEPSPTAAKPPLTFRRGGVLAPDPRDTIPEHVRPYPYQPAPPMVASPLDGTYLRIFDFDDLRDHGGGIPNFCARCPPFRLVIGLSTLVIYRGEWYLEHQSSGFRSLGHARVREQRIELLNAPHCQEGAREPADLGVYRWQLRGEQLTLTLIDEQCTYGAARALDLTFAPWTRVNPCLHPIRNLWPGAVTC